MIRGKVQSDPKRYGENAVALAGNPNVGKSTVFNALTGLHQHTGNWPGKTVANAVGQWKTNQRTYTLTDLPGCYSLLAGSAEEHIARDYICFAHPSVTVVVCDATALERNLILVLQILEITNRVVVCVNLLDEAKRHGITVDTEKLEQLLGVPVVGTVAGKKKGLQQLKKAIDQVYETPPSQTVQIDYGSSVEPVLERLTQKVRAAEKSLPARWTALRLWEGNLPETVAFPDIELPEESPEKLVTGVLVRSAEYIASLVVHKTPSKHRPEIFDKLMTGKYTAFPMILLMLSVVFWLTMQGANVPSAWLQKILFQIEDIGYRFTSSLGVPFIINDAFWHGAYRVTAWVVSVMLPPMAIFFPLFTFAEDVGVLPRVAFDLDRGFQCCNACGKQSLCMMMGLGCNAAGVVGCRIIETKRERLIAMLTNVFMPCNGRFPTLIALITMFFVGTGAWASLGAALWLAAIIVLGVAATFLCSKFLSMTVLRGTPSRFVLELPPYRKPRIGQIIVRSVLDRTLFVLGRAVSVAAPAGLVIWGLTHITVGGVSLISRLAVWLSPIVAPFGIDGTIALGFLLGLPANEIVLPLILLGYQGGTVLAEMGTLSGVRQLLVANGWSVQTALCVTVLCLMHFPCSTTLWTIKKESGSWGWALLAAVLPTVLGLACCLVINLIL